MTKAAHFSRPLSCLALLCACAILLAWVVPATIALMDDMSGWLEPNQNHPVSDRPAEQLEITDITDDPVLLSTSEHPGPRPLMFSLHTAHLIEQTWTFAPPVRPPIVHA